MISFLGADLLTSSYLLYSLPHIVAAEQAGVAGASASATAAAASAAAAAARALPPARIALLWATAAAGNALGSCVVAVAAAQCLFAHPYSAPARAWAAKAADAKVALSTRDAFVRGIGANALVNAAIVMSAASSTPGGKIAAMWVPIGVFVALGLEHSVANMFLLPFGYICGGSFSISEALLGNLVPVAAGNLVGALCIAALYAPPAAAQPRPAHVVSVAAHAIAAVGGRVGRAAHRGRGRHGEGPGA